MTPKEYIMERYPIPRDTRKGMTVCTKQGKLGVLSGWSYSYIAVRLTGEKGIRYFHPLDLAYGVETWEAVNKRIAAYNQRIHEFNRQLNSEPVGREYMPRGMQETLTVIDEQILFDFEAFKSIAVRLWDKKDVQAMVYPTADGQFAYCLKSRDGKWWLLGNGYATEDEASESAYTYLEAHLREK